MATPPVMGQTRISEGAQIQLAQIRQAGIALIFHSLVFWFSLVFSFSNQGNSLVFRVFSAVFLCFSRVFTAVERAKHPWCFWWFSLVFA